MIYEHLFITTLLLIFGICFFILLIKSMREVKGASRDEHLISPVIATRAKFKPYLTTRQIKERERLLQLVRARREEARFRSCRKIK